VQNYCSKMRPDVAFDADPLINTLVHHPGDSAEVPKVRRDCDYALYCERNLIERFFNKTKALWCHRHTS
jgi:hypothetical protein